MSISPKGGSVKSPGLLAVAINGQGRGFNWQKRKKSFAQSAGSITMLHWTKPAARPEVLPLCAPERIAARRVLGLTDSLMGFPLERVVGEYIRELVSHRITNLDNVRFTATCADHAFKTH